jgi:hypothetical protein
MDDGAVCSGCKKAKYVARSMRNLRNLRNSMVGWTFWLVNNGSEGYCLPRYTHSPEALHSIIEEQHKICNQAELSRARLYKTQSWTFSSQGVQLILMWKMEPIKHAWLRFDWWKAGRAFEATRRFLHGVDSEGLFSFLRTEYLFSSETALCKTRTISIVSRCSGTIGFDVVDSL